MLCFLTTFFIFLIKLIEIEEIEKNIESIYSTFTASLSLSFATNGLIALTFIFLKLTYIPLSILEFIILMLLLKNKYNRQKLSFILRNFICEFNQIFKSYKESFFLKIIYFLLLALFIVSIGPINSYDSINVYVGYPYQFWLKNSFFIDGGYHQGILGIADFANIFYFQDKTTWLIRTTQFIPLIPFVFLVIRRNTNNLIILVILTSPVFCQWLTLGKNNFLSESCVAILFLVWERNKSIKDLKLLIAMLMISIAFKISAILISLPIIIYIIYFYRNKINQIDIKFLINQLFYTPLIISFLSLLVISGYKYFLTGNPIFPLFSSFFTPKAENFIWWENLLRNYGRENPFFQIWLFIPKSLGKISYVLGPSNLILFLFSLFLIIRRFNYKLKINFYVGMAQFLLLLLFSQGRADYYASPILISYVGIRNFDFIKKDYKNALYKKFFNYMLFSQIIMWSISILYLTSINLITFANFQFGMDKFAWNFYNSKIIKQEANPPVYDSVFGISNLFYKDKFVQTDAFLTCERFENNNLISDKFDYCINKLGVKTIIVERNKLSNNHKYYCDEKFLKRISRNIFLENKVAVDFCYLK